ncbi:MAG TPA: hypothetical protein VKM55_14670 [Candidatus Lokiarchaeia archaeon]|nr:hypothetical protein [Candidatus Lokiarchaeia archaeon]
MDRSSLFKVLNIREIPEVQYLDAKLKVLLHQGKIESKTQDGKNYYKKAESSTLMLQ